MKYEPNDNMTAAQPEATMPEFRHAELAHAINRFDEVATALQDLYNSIRGVPPEVDAAQLKVYDSLLQVLNEGPGDLHAMVNRLLDQVYRLRADVLLVPEDKIETPVQVNKVPYPEGMDPSSLPRAPHPNLR